MAVNQVTVIDCSNQGATPGDAREALVEDGVVVLRNAFPRASVDDVAERVKRYFAQPAVAGSPGYYKIDHPKKLLDACVVGGPIYDLILDERVIDLVEEILGSESILAEMNVKYDAPVGYSYFAAHSDFWVGWRKKENTKALTEADLIRPVGIGGAIYLHETHEGAFCYYLGSHKKLVRAGEQDLSKVREPERSEIIARRVRVDGEKGDLVLFDDRGYHGPDQPSSKERTVILVDYYRVATFGRRVVTPYAIWSTDLARLSPRQIKMLGAGADTWADPWSTLHAKFHRNNPLYGPIVRAIESSYLHRHWRSQLRSWIRG
jgi:ectoine hydroxylase-related dioxygenase (phytanoyl-CoA dioxygenase family)